MNKLTFNIGDVFFGSDTFPRERTAVGPVVSAIVSTLILFAGAIFVVLIVIGGFSMIVGAGQGNPQKVGQGRQAVTTALVGFLIISTAFLIVRIIETMTGIAIL